LAADATALPIATAAVDRVLLLDIIEHLHPWQVSSLLDEVKRILRPSGYVVIHTLPNRWALAAAYPLLRLWAWRLPADARSRYERAVHVNEQDPLGLRRTLQRAGLTARVWVEEWTTVYAARGRGRDYPDRTRSEGYEVLRSSTVRLVAGAAMRTPARWFVGNDLFALAWKQGHPGPPATGRFAPLRRSLAVSAPRSRRGVR
jgi:SAM-dependent methyltransferase